MKLKLSEINGYTVGEYEQANVYFIENLLDNEFCDATISLIETLPLEKIKSRKQSNVECNVAYYNHIRKLDDRFYYIFNTEESGGNVKVTNKLNGVTQEVITNFTKKMNNYMKIIRNVIGELDKNICFSYNCGYNLRRIYGKTHNHIDALLGLHRSDIVFIDSDEEEDKYEMVRNASLVFALNDDYIGGVFKFPKQNIELRMKKGSVLIFPPYWTHPHEVSTLENGTVRYTINTWAFQKV
jgi:2OG-Fe(II) oxygenase superfamily